MWVILLISVLVIFGVRVAIRSAKAEFKMKRKANAHSGRAKRKSTTSSPTPVLKWVEQPGEYPRVDVEWEETFREIERAVSRSDYDFARTWLQKFSYTTFDKDVPQAVRDRFKTLMTAFAKQDPLYLKLIAKIRPIVEAQPGLLQTALYPQLPGFDEEQIRYVLYFAHELGDVNRLKKARSYQVFLPDQQLPELPAKKSKPTEDERWKMSLAYKKERLKQLKDPDLLKSRPYWKYVSNKAVGEPCHSQWDGLVLRYDDPWWKNHFPPKSKKCHCRVTAVRPDEYTGQIAPTD